MVLEILLLLLMPVTSTSRRGGIVTLDAVRRMHAVSRVLVVALVCTVLVYLLSEMNVLRHPAEGDAATVTIITRNDTEDSRGSEAAEGNFTVDNSVTQLEYLVNVPATAMYMREPRIRPSHRPDRVNVACMYAGFVRDFENMLSSCRDVRSSGHCGVAKRRKFFGNQRRFILAATDCDVFISTWDIRGAGRYTTVTYDMNAKITPEAIKQQYGEQLAVLHMQKYEAYLPLWKMMHYYKRAFPQTIPKTLNLNKSSDESSWTGTPETNGYLRRNDYSQSYKHWCVMQLVLTFSTHYDAYFRLRTDLRTTRRFHELRFDSAIGQPYTNKSVAFRLVVDPGASGGIDEDERLAQNRNMIVHFVHNNRIHTNHFDIADFGFMGTLDVIRELASIWPRYCTANSTEKVSQIVHGMYSEYNYMVWRIIFDQKWEVDSGRRYLWVSRKSMPSTGGSGGKRFRKKRA